MGLHAATKSLRPLVVIDDKDHARRLRADGWPFVVLVPSERSMARSVVKEIEKATGMPYYSIAVDHALHRATNMAIKLTQPGLSTITAKHIIQDAMLKKK